MMTQIHQQVLQHRSWFVEMAKWLPIILILTPFVIAACESNGQGSLADELPLDTQRPTFIFFYTDG